MAMQPASSSSYTSDNFITAHVVNETVASLQAAGSSLQATVDCLVVCYSSASSSNDEFRDLRTRLTKSAFLYRDLHLPLSTQLVNNLSNLMSLYDAIDDAAFCEHISVVAREVKRHADQATKVIQVHVHLLEDLNKLQMDARSTLDLLATEAKGRQAMADHYREEGVRIAKKEKRFGVLMGGTAAMWTVDAALLAGFPLLSGLYAGGAALYTAGSAYTLQKAKDRLNEYAVLSTAESKEGEMACQAAEIIRDPLTAAVENFIRSVGKIAGFLQKLEGDVSNYAANAGRMGANATSMVIYLKLIKSQSSRIQQACGDYLQIMPAVEGRMGALSGFGASDPNHVQRWLALKFPEHDPATLLA